MSDVTATTLSGAFQNLIQKQNQLVHLGTILEVRADGTVIALIKGEERIVEAISDQPFFAGSQARFVLDDTKGWVLLGTTS